MLSIAVTSCSGLPPPNCPEYSAKDCLTGGSTFGEPQPDNINIDRQMKKKSNPDNIFDIADIADIAVAPANLSQSK